LGFRFSKYNIKNALNGYNIPLGERNFAFLNALRISLKEDCSAYWFKLNAGKDYVHKDFE
jgi:hypothetical protein